MYVARDCIEEGVERGRGQWFIRQTFDWKLGENRTLSVMAKFRQDVNSAFYIRYSNGNAGYSRLWQSARSERSTQST